MIYLKKIIVFMCIFLCMFNVVWGVEENNLSGDNLLTNNENQITIITPETYVFKTLKGEI